MSESDPFDPLSLEGNGFGPRDGIARAREALAPVRAALEAAGFYAYGTIDEENRWVVSADDETGRVDVRLGSDGFAIDLWTTSPGFFADEENDIRRRARERLARMTLPNLTRGFLAPHQAAWWDDEERGPAARVRYELPFTRAGDAGTFAREHLAELEELLAFVETQIAS
ncbi:MAG: hypothetical protein U0031_21905 [Thermomicrobiales bacterium]